MDIKQFNRLQQAVQTVVDEDRAYSEHYIWNDNHSMIIGVEEYSTAWSWDQGTWAWGTTTDQVAETNKGRVFQLVCGTGGCLAGTGVVQAGDRLIYAKGEHLKPGQVTQVEFCVGESGKVHAIENRARKLFGLTNEQAARLFAGGNSAQRIVSLATEYAAENGHTLVVI